MINDFEITKKILSASNIYLIFPWLAAFEHKTRIKGQKKRMALDFLHMTHDKWNVQNLARKKVIINENKKRMGFNIKWIR